MAETFFFYDLETSGADPKSARIMQFAGQRTDMELKPIGESYDVKIQISEDIVPEPDAILVTGITPQQVNSEGISEKDFFKLFTEEIVQPNTTFVGFNNIRFDDEFIRYGLYRNFYDPYEWHWRDSCSRWDILDVVRLTRALRPDGIQWPYASDGDPSNRLELLTEVNKLDHKNAHDALNDVMATIAVAGLIKANQPRLFEFAYRNRGKQAVEELATKNEPFVYVSGRYAKAHQKLTTVYSLGKHPTKSGCVVFDLRFDPTEYLSLTTEELVKLWHWPKDEHDKTLPVKTLQYNRCPAVAPLSVIRPEDAERLQLDMNNIKQNVEILKNDPDFYTKIVEAAKQLEAEFKQTLLLANENTVEQELYSGFINDEDKRQLPAVRSAAPSELSKFQNTLSDQRLKGLLLLYKARNYPKELTAEEQTQWEVFKRTRLENQLPRFIKRLEELSVREGLTSQETYLLEELKLYIESIVPVEA